MADYGLEGRIRKAFEFLSSINQTAYKDIYLLSNEVLSKNPLTNNFLSRFLQEEAPQPINRLYVFSKFLHYYFKSIVHFILYLLNFIVFYVSRLRYAINYTHKEFILIDTFFLIDRIDKAGNYADEYFVGLRELLNKLNKHYAYLPVFCSTKNPLKLFRAFKLIKKEEIPVLTEYQILSISDVFLIFLFMLIYPFRVLKLVETLDSNYAKCIGDGDITELVIDICLLKNELIDNLSHVTFHRFSRYLQGRKIAALPYDKIKLISWFENQTIDKNLYKGLRERENKIKIYGIQSFIFSNMVLNILVDENENKFGILPDRIIVNGSYYVPKATNIDFIVGPSFRYRKVFSTVINKNKQSHILVLLPYVADDTRNILGLLNKMNLPAQNVIIKPHPVVTAEIFSSLIPNKSQIVNTDLYELLKTSKIVIGAASGSLAEAASLGIPVISVKNMSGIDYNPLPEYGKGIIWDEVTSSFELERAITQFECALKDKIKNSEIEKVAKKYKEMFFCEPTEESIIRSLELND